MGMRSFCELCMNQSQEYNGRNFSPRPDVKAILESNSVKDYLQFFSNSLGPGNIQT